MTTGVKAARWKPGVSPPEPGVLLIRHGPRLGGATPPPLAGLTDQGRWASVRLGSALKSCRPSFILSSPLERCVATGGCIVKGAGWGLTVRSSRLLGDPGPFVVPEKITLTDDSGVAHARDHGDWESLLQRHVRGENIPGMKHRAQGTRYLCEQLFDRLGSGYILCISHDSIIAAITASLGLRANPWPGFLEGITIKWS